MTTLREQLSDDLKDAMRARETVRRDTLRLLQAAVKNAEIEARSDLSDTDVQALIQRQIKQRHDSIEQFEKGGRDDLAAQERSEIAVLEGYLPEQLSREQVEELARAAIERAGASGPADKGKVMGPLMGELRGKADGALVNAVVTELLGAD